MDFTQLFKIDAQPDMPLFEQVRIRVIAAVREGALPAGTRLPTVRELAGQLGGGHNSGHCILPAESLGQAGTRRCLSKRKKDEQNTCVFEERHVK